MVWVKEEGQAEMTDRRHPDLCCNGGEELSSKPGSLTLSFLSIFILVSPCPYHLPSNSPVGFRIPCAFFLLQISISDCESIKEKSYHTVIRVKEAPEPIESLFLFDGIILNGRIRLDPESNPFPWPFPVSQNQVH